MTIVWFTAEGRMAHNAPTYLPTHRRRTKGLTHGQHRIAPKENTPLANLWTTMLQDAGAEVDRFADSNGTAHSLLA